MTGKLIWINDPIGEVRLLFQPEEVLFGKCRLGETIFGIPARPVGWKRERFLSGKPRSTGLAFIVDKRNG